MMIIMTTSKRQRPAEFLLDTSPLRRAQSEAEIPGRQYTFTIRGKLLKYVDTRAFEILGVQDLSKNTSFASIVLPNINSCSLELD